MASAATSTGGHEVLPRYIFFETLIPRAKVLEIGAVVLTGGRSARFLKERGAEEVLAIDVDEEGARRAAQDAPAGVVYRAGDYRELAKASFDLIFVHASAPLVAEPDRLLALKSLLARRGRLMVAVRHRDGIALGAPADPREPDPEALEAQLKGQFESVERAAQTAFAGYSVAPQGLDEPTTALDESLADSATPAYTLFLCGARATRLDTVAMTPLPSDVVRQLVSAPASPPASPPSPSLSLLGDFDQDLQDQRVRELEQRTQAALEAEERAELAAAQALAERDALKARLNAGPGPEVKEELAKAAQALQAAEAGNKRSADALEALQATSAAASARADEAERRLSAAEEGFAGRLKAAQEQAAALQERLAEATRQAGRAEELERKLAEVREHAVALERELHQAREKADQAYELAEQLEQLHAERDAEAAKSARAEEAIGATIRRVRELEEESESRLAEIEDHRSQVKKARAALEREAAQRAKAENASAEAEERVSYLEELLEEKVMELEGRLTAEKATRAEAEAAVKVAQERANQMEKDISQRDTTLDSVRGELEEIGKSFEASLAAVEAADLELGTRPKEDGTQADVVALAKELELTRAEADQLLAFVVERQAEAAREYEARMQAERAVTAAEARIRELNEKLQQLEHAR